MSVSMSGDSNTNSNSDFKNPDTRVISPNTENKNLHEEIKKLKQEAENNNQVLKLAREETQKRVD